MSKYKEKPTFMISPAPTMATESGARLIAGSASAAMCDTGCLMKMIEGRRIGTPVQSVRGC
jgi:hypothetical protein